MAPASWPPWPGSSTTSTGPSGFHAVNTAWRLHGVETSAPAGSALMTGSTTPVGDATAAVNGTVVVGAGGTVVVSGGAGAVVAGTADVVVDGAVMALALPLPEPFDDAQPLASTSAPRTIRNVRRMDPACHPLRSLQIGGRY